MKFVCTQENISRGLSRITSVAGRNPQLPILENALLSLRDGVMHATCTDLEIGVHTTIPGKVESEGGCTVPARKLFEYTQQLPGDNPITLELRGSRLHVKTRGWQAQFPTASEDDFPLLPTPPADGSVEVGGATTCQGLAQVIFAAARDDTRPEIHSAYLHGEGKRITIAATDSFRLAEKHLVLDQDVAQEFTILLPLNTAQEIVRLFSDTDTLTITPHDNHLTVRGGTTEVSSRLIDGTYPAYQQIIPQSHATVGMLDRAGMLRALKTLTIFLPRDSRRITMSLKPSKKMLTLAVAGSDSGESRVELDFDGTGDDLDILFNVQYLLDGVQQMTTERVQLKTGGSNDPAVLSPDDEGQQYTYVVMPIQA